MLIPETEPHIDISKIKYRKQPLRELKKMNKNHPIVGWDTETYNGYARLICNSMGQYLLIDKQQPDSATFIRILNFLTAKRWRGTHGFFWNMEYDIAAVLKYAGREIAEDLYKNGEIQIGKYKITYIPKKLFSIEISKHLYEFYDLYQFYSTSLDAAAQKHLGEKKATELVDRTRLNDDFSLWQEREKEIIAYCIKDCELTQKLGEKLKDTLKHNIGFIPSKYVSKAFISKEYFRRHTTIPTAPDFPPLVNRMALLAYFGGRFEITQRGNIGYCSLLDINSSYPYAMTLLKAYPKDAWKKSDNIRYEDTHGFYKIKVDVPDNLYIAPFPFRYKQRVIFPKGEFITYATKEEILAYENICDIQIISGVEAVGEGEFFLRSEIQKLYEWKNKAKGNDMEYMLVKIILNSLYGAFYEKQKKGDEYLTGKLFAPVYAALITAIGRINLYKEALKYGRRIVGMATDSILVRGKAETQTSKELGGWSFETDGETLVLMSGIYKLGDKIRMRGMAVSRVGKIKTPHGEYEDIFRYIEDKPQLSTYVITHERPIKLGEVLTHTKLRRWEDLNVWHEVERKIDINADAKREWHDDFMNGEDFLSRSIDSEPININELVEFIDGKE